MSLVKQAKKLWLKSGNGSIICLACGFSFIEKYGKIGEGYIEVHHKISISTFRVETEVKPSDLVPVCSNCHRMLHRTRPWKSIEDLQKLISGT